MFPILNSVHFSLRRLPLDQQKLVQRRSGCQRIWPPGDETAILLEHTLREDLPRYEGGRRDKVPCGPKAGKLAVFPRCWWRLQKYITWTKRLEKPHQGIVLATELWERRFQRFRQRKKWPFSSSHWYYCKWTKWLSNTWFFHWIRLERPVPSYTVWLWKLCACKSRQR